MWILLRQGQLHFIYMEDYLGWDLEPWWANNQRNNMGFLSWYILNMKSKIASTKV